MIEGPHIIAFSPAALCINLTSALASARWVASASASMNAAALSLVGLVLLSAIRAPSLSSEGYPGTRRAATRHVAEGVRHESGCLPDTADVFLDSPQHSLSPKRTGDKIAGATK